MIDRYLEMDVMTASPMTLVIKLYEGALRNARIARLHLEDGHVSKRVVAIDKTLSIVGELQGSLDFERGGEIATQLSDLYNFVTSRILEANSAASTKAIDEAVDVLETLLEGWQHIAQNPNGVCAEGLNP